MRVRRMILLPALVLSICLLSLVGCEKGLPPELIAAQDAVTNAEAEGAPDLCPDKYDSAELKLRQAQLLYEDGESETATEAAMAAEEMAKEAADCALAAKQPGQEPTSLLPQELDEFSLSVYFAFNDNSIQPTESKKLAAAAATFAKYQEEYEFWVVLTSHADRPGHPQANFELTDRRARVVRHLLIQNGVDPVRFIIKPMGEKLANLAMIEAKGKSKKKNKDFRRVDLTITSVDPSIRN
jgi:outer membrane protein OmpA-like peptidoglycan-associated protein